MRIELTGGKKRAATGPVPTPPARSKPKAGMSTKQKARTTGGRLVREAAAKKATNAALSERRQSQALIQAAKRQQQARAAKSNKPANKKATVTRPAATNENRHIVVGAKKAAAGRGAAEFAVTPKNLAHPENRTGAKITTTKGGTTFTHGGVSKPGSYEPPAKAGKKASTKSKAAAKHPSKNTAKAAAPHTPASKAPAHSGGSGDTATNATVSPTPTSSPAPILLGSGGGLLDSLGSFLPILLIAGAVIVGIYLYQHPGGKRKRRA